VEEFWKCLIWWCVMRPRYVRCTVCDTWFWTNAHTAAGPPFCSDGCERVFFDRLDYSNEEVKNVP